MTLFSPRCEYTRVYPYVCVCVCVHAYVCGCLHAALCFWKAIFSTVTVIFGSSIFSSGFPSTSLSVHRLSLFLLVRTLHLESQVPSHFWLSWGGFLAFSMPTHWSIQMKVWKKGMYSEVFLTTSCLYQNCSVACDQSVFHIGKVSICCLRQKHAMASLCCSLALWWWTKAYIFFSLSSTVELIVHLLWTIPNQGIFTNMPAERLHLTTSTLLEIQQATVQWK